MATIVIIPTCDDLNRGDQALVWETRRIAEQAGYHGTYYMLSEAGTSTAQSEKVGITPLLPVLRHPAASYKPETNLRYDAKVLTIWGLISLGSFLRSVLLLTTWGRAVLTPSLSEGARETLRVMSRADAHFVKGGGFLHSTNSVTDPYRGYYFVFHILLAKSLGKPVYVMPNSYGPLKGVIYRWLVRQALNKCELVTARETISARELNHVQVEARNYPDLGFGLAGRPGLSRRIDELRQANAGRPIVAITARPYRFPGAVKPDVAYAHYLDELALFCSWLYEHGYFPVLVEHTRSIAEHESDASAIAEIEARLESGTFATLTEPSADCRDLKAVYGACDYVVGTRFHSVIFALSEGVPALAIGYGGHKARGIMRDLSLEEFVMDIHNFNAVSAQERFRELVESDTVPLRLQNALQSIQQGRRELVQAILESRPGG